MTDRELQAPSQVMTVSELVSLIKQAIDENPQFRRVVVEGELTEFKMHQASGHAYFSLAEKTFDRAGGRLVRIPCVMFQSWTQYMTFVPQVGDQVRLIGQVGFYADRGQVQLYATQLFPVGAGAAQRARRALEERLLRDGVFSPERKRPMPELPLLVAVVTSPTGAAVHDVENVMKKRFPQASLTVVPCLVQGVDAPDSIIRALHRAYLLPGVQAVMIVRGGGSRDDLNPFDDERLVREVARSPIPVMSGVGHDVDSTFCDRAADQFAPTPSAAAERLFPDARELENQLNAAGSHLESLVRARLGKQGDRLSELAKRCADAASVRLRNSALWLDDLSDRLSSAALGRVRHAALKLQGISSTIEALSPRLVLSRGYSVCLKGGVPVRSVGDLTPGDGVTLQLSDGQAQMRCQSLTEYIC